MTAIALVAPSERQAEDRSPTWLRCLTIIGRSHGLNLTVVNPLVDATFRFMTLDWDGKIRMDCSSPYAMARLIARQHEFAVATDRETSATRMSMSIVSLRWSRMYCTLSNHAARNLRTASGLPSTNPLRAKITWT